MTLFIFSVINYAAYRCVDRMQARITHISVVLKLNLHGGRQVSADVSENEPIHKKQHRDCVRFKHYERLPLEGAKPF